MHRDHVHNKHCRYQHATASVAIHTAQHRKAPCIISLTSVNINASLFEDSLNQKLTDVSFLLQAPYSDRSFLALSSPKEGSCTLMEHQQRNSFFVLSKLSQAFDTSSQHTFLICLFLFMLIFYPNS